MTVTTLEFNHDYLDKLAAFIASRKRQHVFAELMFNAISGNPESAEMLERRFGLKIVAQKRVRAPAIVPVIDAALCSDCPPEGYPNDKTRCGSCPRSRVTAERG